MANFIPLPITVHGNIFRVDSAYYLENFGAPEAEWSFTIRVNNLSGNWVDASVDRGDGTTTTCRMST